MRRFLWVLPAALILLAGCKPNAVWSPDGKQLALDPRGRLFTYDVATKKFRQHTRGPQLTVGPVWSPDGARIAYHSLTIKGGLASATDLMALDVATGRHSVLVPKLRTMGEKSGDHGLGSPPELIREMLHVGWSPDGKQLAYTAAGEDEPTLWVANADGSESRSLLKERQSAYSFAWSPDNRRIAFLSSVAPREGQMQGTVSLEVIDADGANRRTLWDGAARGSLAGFGPGPLWTADSASIWTITELEKKDAEPFGRKVGFWRVSVNGPEQPVEGPQLDAPSAFLTGGHTGTAFFFAPKEQNEENPRIGFTGPGFSAPVTLGTLTPAAAGLTIDQARDIDGFPVPNISPDGSRIAVAFVPKKGPASLLLYAAQAGAKPERLSIPFPAPAKPAAKKPVAKKPAPKKPVRKR